MKELGQVLRMKRESMGLSLSEVEVKTKIRKRYLEALEQGDWSVLPGDVYARGFIRSYAEILGLDGMGLLVELDERNAKKRIVGTSGDTVPPHHPEGASVEPRSMGMEDGQAKAPMETAKDEAVFHSQWKKTDSFQSPNHTKHAMHAQQKQPMSTTKKKNRDRTHVQSNQTKWFYGWKFNGFSQVAVVVGALVVIGAGWAILKSHSPRSAADGPIHSVGLTDTTNTTSALETGISNSSDASLQNNQTVIGQTYGTPHSANSASGSNLSNQSGLSNGGTGHSLAQAVQISSGSFQNGQQTYTVSTNAPLTVQLKAISQSGCWVQVSADKTMIDPNDLIAQGQTKSWSANQTMTIRVGNVRGAQISVDGQPIILPNTNQPINVTFVKQSIQ